MSPPIASAVPLTGATLVGQARSLCVNLPRWTSRRCRRFAAADFEGDRRLRNESTWSISDQTSQSCAHSWRRCASADDIARATIGHRQQVVDRLAFGSFASACSMQLAARVHSGSRRTCPRPATVRARRAAVSKWLASTGRPRSRFAWPSQTSVGRSRAVCSGAQRTPRLSLRRRWWYTCPR